MAAPDRNLGLIFPGAAKFPDFTGQDGSRLRIDENQAIRDGEGAPESDSAIGGTASAPEGCPRPIRIGRRTCSYADAA